MKPAGNGWIDTLLLAGIAFAFAIALLAYEIGNAVAWVCRLITGKRGAGR